VCWSRCVDCICNEERKERRRIKQYFRLYPKVLEAVVLNYVYAIQHTP
jgi:hypothetical protein